MYKNEKYVSGNYSLEKMFTASWEEKQTAEYAVAMNEYFYSQQLNDKTEITYSEQENFSTLRLMAAGNQPEEWYKTWLSGGNAPTTTIDNFWVSDRETIKKGYMNLDWSIFSLMPKILSILIPIIKNIDYNIVVDCVDPLSGSEEEDRMIEAYKRSIWGKSLDEISKMNEIPLSVNEDVEGSFEELEQMRLEGLFKPEYAISLAKIAKWTEDHTGWDEHIYENLILDAITLSKGVVYEDFDYETRTSKWHYANPGYVGSQYSDKRDGSDADWKFIVDKMRVSELMTIFPESDPEEWKNLCKTLIGYEGNREPSNWENNSGWESFYVPILKSWWIDTKITPYINHKTSMGRERIYEMNRSKNYLLNDKKTKFDHSLRIAMESKWVIGTKYTWDYGVLKNQARPNKRKPILPIFTYSFPYKSIVERLSPVMHQLQISWLKYQNAMATAFPGGIAVDIGMINNITDGGKKIPFMDVIKMMFEKGFLPYKLSYTGEYKGGGVSPIQPIPSDLVSKLNDYLMAISGVVRLVEELTGLSPVALGSTPTSDQQVGTTELSYQSTMNALKHIVDGLRILKQNVASCSCERIRIYSKVDEQTRNVYESVIGKKGMDLLMEADKKEVQYGYKCVARPQDIEKNALFNDIEQSYQRYVNNQPGINEGQKARLRSMIQGGMDIGYAGRIMESWIKADIKRRREEAEQNSMMQSQVIQQQDTNKAKNDYELMKTKTQSEILINSEKEKERRETLLLVEQEKNRGYVAENNRKYEESLNIQENAD